MQITNNEYNTMPEQVQENKNNIEAIAKKMLEFYHTEQVLAETTTSIDIAQTDIEDLNISQNAFIITTNALFFKIVAIVENVVYIKYWANIGGV